MYARVRSEALGRLEAWPLVFPADTFVAADVLLETLPGEPVRLEAYVATSGGGMANGAAAGPGELLVVAKDAGHNVVARRTIGADDAACRALGTEGGAVRRMEVRDAAVGALVITNPQRAACPGEARLYWGDLRVHTHVSDDASSERGLDDAGDAVAGGGEADVVGADGADGEGGGGLHAADGAVEDGVHAVAGGEDFLEVGYVDATGLVG